MRLQGFIQKLLQTDSLLRPPGALAEKDFLNHCIRCRKCMEACPYFSIEMAHDYAGAQMGTPYINPEKIPCYLCEDFPCIEACPSEALKPVRDIEQVAMGYAVIIKENCFAYNGIICRSCYERCPIYTEAIILRDELYPEVVKEKCVGCGICAHVCPANPKAIEVIPESAGR
jgi:MauM/NapG family ferredoxin protein